MSITRGINHIGLTVPDIELATEFFKQGLDGKVAYESQTQKIVLERANLLKRY